MEWENINIEAMVFDASTKVSATFKLLLGRMKKLEEMVAWYEKEVDKLKAEIDDKKNKENR